MSSAHLLCDPALLMPPPAEKQAAVRFWLTMIEWASDQRLRLGPASHQTVLSLLGSHGWPDRERADYPPGLGPEAHRSLTKMLTRVLSADVPLKSPALTPSYRAGKEGEVAIGSDAASLHNREDLLGLATHPENWDEPCDAVRFNPPPPQCLPLLFEPEGPLAGEIDLSVRRYLKTRRLTLVGGVRNDTVLSQIQERFAPAEIRWLAAEPGSRLNLAPLTGLRAGRDVVYCLTGHIGHEASIKANKCCRSRGLQLRKVEKASDVFADLCRRHGGAPSEA